ELDTAVDLGTHLHGSQNSRERLQLAERIGRALANVHNHGISHNDLYSKHVYVTPASGTIRFIDWQRSCRHRFVSWRLRCRDLATLNATVAEDFLSGPERSFCLAAYLQESEPRGSRRRLLLSKVMRRVTWLTKHLVQNKKIALMRRGHAPLPGQNR